MHYYILLVVLILVVIGVKGFMRLFNPEKFLLLQPWRRVEAGSNSASNETPEAFSAMGQGV